MGSQSFDSYFGAIADRRFRLELERLKAQGAIEAEVEGYDPSKYDPMGGRGNKRNGKYAHIRPTHYERDNSLIEAAHDELMRWINGSKYRDTCTAYLSFMPPDNTYFDKFKKGETDSVTIGRYTYQWSKNKGDYEYNKTPQQIKRGFYLSVWNANEAFNRRTDGEYELVGTMVPTGWVIELRTTRERKVRTRAKHTNTVQKPRADARTYIGDDDILGF